MFQFRITKKDKKSRARMGVLRTPHGAVHTPAFVPVGTKAALRGISFDRAKQYGGEMFMVNTYHLFHNERYKIIGKFGGLHAYAKIDAPLMTDSGGFQVFSLGFGSEHGVGKIADIFPVSAKAPAGRPSEKITEYRGNNFVKIDDTGATFKNPVNGQMLWLTPKKSIEIQQILGADIIFSFDECTSPLSSYEYTKKALKRTHTWAEVSLKTFYGNKHPAAAALWRGKQAMLGIVQGGEYEDLRKESAQAISSLSFFGYAIGGSLGKSKNDMYRILDLTIPLLDEKKIKHLLGIGEVDDIFESVERGIDLFDCVAPTRWARHGSVLTSKGRINIRNKQFLIDKKPLDIHCACTVCKTYSRAYISHLYREKEVYAIMLMTEHNVAWMLDLMRRIRLSLKAGEFQKFKKQTLQGFQ
ncbi:MAG: tRNA-guanine transglycosylase [Parcubacteria group bacterium GW2011_GWC1_41_7]|nr:MAG: tRNA-guanine transglycosylase [Parcubacteria group bacterium GW2011_GWC1_41_7]